MICAGKVLSQPPITTTESIGCARIISSVSIAIRLRRYIEVGNAKLSAIEMVGNTIGMAPASITPRFTAIAHRLDKGLAQEQRESSVAITRQSLAKSVSHLNFLFAPPYVGARVT